MQGVPEALMRPALTKIDTHQMPVISMGMLIDVPSFYAIYCHGKGLSREPQPRWILFRWHGKGVSREPWETTYPFATFDFWDYCHGIVCLLGVPSIGRLIHLGFLFSWLICTFKDSVPDGSLKRSNFVYSVIPMVAPTWCHRAIGGNPAVGECWLTWFRKWHF